MKAVHGEISAAIKHNDSRTGLKLIEIHREDIDTLPQCLSFLRPAPDRFIVFCDDLSFDANDTSYKSLKAVLEGGIEGRPDNVVFYATSNRRHLMPREMMENERSTAINPSESVEEKVSLSDRFGLWIGFHNCSQAEYLDMVTGYVDYYGLENRSGNLATRGAGMGHHTWGTLRAGRLAIHTVTRRSPAQTPITASLKLNNCIQIAGNHRPGNPRAVLDLINFLKTRQNGFDQPLSPVRCDFWVHSSFRWL